MKSMSFHQYSWNSEVDTTWISLIGWHHKTSSSSMTFSKNSWEVFYCKWAVSAHKIVILVKLNRVFFCKCIANLMQVVRKKKSRYLASKAGNWCKTWIEHEPILGFLKYVISMWFSVALNNKPESFQPLKASQTFQYFKK